MNALSVFHPAIWGKIGFLQRVGPVVAYVFSSRSMGLNEYEYGRLHVYYL